MKKAIVIVCLSAFLCVNLCFPASAISAKAAISINGETGEVIFSHNADAVLPMASTTKIMTALLLCEMADFDKEITVTDEMLRVEGSSMGLLPGDRVTFHDLLYGLLLASGNDAANVTAYALGGTVNGFVKMMNDKAEQLGLEDTNFVTPSGLDAEGHATTAKDLANLARYALQNEDFAKAAASKSATLNFGNPPYRRTLTNHNRLLKTFDGAVGVKTGFTKKSGRCLVSAARRDGKLVIAVTLNDPNDWADHKELLESGLSQIKTTEITPETTHYKIPVISGQSGVLEVNIEPYTVNSLDSEGFSYEINLPQFVYAPINEGEAVGSVVYKKGDEVIEEVSLCAEEKIQTFVPKPDVLKEITENMKLIFRNIWEK